MENKADQIRLKQRSIRVVFLKKGHRQMNACCAHISCEVQDGICYQVALPIILLFDYFPILKSDFEIGNTADEIRLNNRFGFLKYHKNGILKCIRLHHQMKAR